MSTYAIIILYILHLTRGTSEDVQHSADQLSFSVLYCKAITMITMQWELATMKLFRSPWRLSSLFGSVCTCRMRGGRGGTWRRPGCRYRPRGRETLGQPGEAGRGSSTPALACHWTVHTRPGHTKFSSPDETVIFIYLFYPNYFLKFRKLHVKRKGITCLIMPVLSSVIMGL